MNPEVSVLIPTKNEEITIEQFINWVHEGFEHAGVFGEIVLADSSTDKTAEMARKLGAKVIKVNGSGLGLAYRMTVPHLRGKYVLVGDADCTYDFRNIGPFLSALRMGDEFVMGSRFKGFIEKKSMPLHHRYFGTPLTTWFLTKMLNLPFSDIHCGMRGLTRELIQKLPFDEPGWEYAPEMIIQACKLTDKYSEVPISFLRQPQGRVSHFKRGKLSFLEPFKAGLGAVRVTLVHSIDKLLKNFGLIFAGISTAVVFFLSLGPVEIAGIKFSSLTQIIGFASGILGWVAVLLGNLMSNIYEQKSTIVILHKRINRLFFSLSGISFLALVSIIATFANLINNRTATIAFLSQRVFIITSLTYLIAVTALALVFMIIENYFSLPSNRPKQTQERRTPQK
jgi:glycosyltransferase involved in cell wall biosynthesis